jgi:hypothetical protein
LRIIIDVAMLYGERENDLSKRKKRQNGTRGSTKVLDEGTKHAGHAAAIHSSAVQ